MSSRFEASLKNEGNNRKETNSIVGRRVMSEKEIQAYLISRDTIRRVQRFSSLVAPPLSRSH
jgi:hypothetical protein